MEYKKQPRLESLGQLARLVGGANQGEVSDGVELIWQGSPPPFLLAHFWNLSIFPHSPEQKIQDRTREQVYLIDEEQISVCKVEDLLVNLPPTHVVGRHDGHGFGAKVRGKSSCEAGLAQSWVSHEEKVREGVACHPDTSHVPA